MAENIPKISKSGVVVKDENLILVSFKNKQIFLKD